LFFKAEDGIRYFHVTGVQTCALPIYIPGLNELVKRYHPGVNGKDHLLLMEFVLHGLAEYSMLSKFRLENGIQFKDMLSSMFTISEEDDTELSDEDIY